MSPRPVYWKPKYGTRSSRHRAWAKQDLAREQRLAQGRGTSVSAWIRGLFRR